MRQGRNKAERSAGFCDAHVTRRAAGAVIDVFERIALGKPCAHHRQRQVLLKPALADLAKRHHFDQRQIHAAAVRPFDQPRKFVVVDALERDCVDLDFQTGRLRGVDTGQHLIE